MSLWVGKVINKNGVVFLDRDGTINVNRDNYVKSWDEFEFLPGAIEAIASICAMGLKIIVVTNQSPIGRKIISADEVDNINRQMGNEIINHGGDIQDIYVCPHLPWVGCDCRKPKPGLLSRAANDYPIDLRHSFMVGDNISDVNAGIAVKCQSILISSNNAFEAYPEKKPYKEVENLIEAVKHIEMQRKAMF